MVSDRIKNRLESDRIRSDGVEWGGVRWGGMGWWEVLYTVATSKGPSSAPRQHQAAKLRVPGPQ